MSVGYKSLYTWVEGDDDHRFVSRILNPIFIRRFDHVNDPIRYAGHKYEKVENYIKSLLSMKAEYILFSDINSCACNSKKKEKLIAKYKATEPERIIIVTTEIESWYYAGLANEICEEWKIPITANTDGLNKEQFNQIFEKMRSPRTVIMNNILDNYSITVAKEKNTSFSYFCNKFNI